MPELTWRSPSFPDQAKKRLIKQVLEHRRQTYNVIFNCTTQIRKTSMVKVDPFNSLSSSSSRHSQRGGRAHTALCTAEWHPQPWALTNKKKFSGVDSPDIFQDCFSLRQASLRANKPLANMKQIFSWILLNNLSRENVKGLAMGVAWGWEPLRSPDVVNSCRIQLTWSLQFCFQLKLDQNQVICQQNVNHCLATFVGT